MATIVWHKVDFCHFPTGRSTCNALTPRMLIVILRRGTSLATFRATLSVMNIAVANDVREMLAEQVQYRGLLYEMTKRDLLLRYKQTVMGFGWAVFTPLLNTALFSVIFTRVAKIDVGMPYPLFAFSGLLAWNFFAAALRFSVSSLTSNGSLVTKVYFPR